MKELKLMAESWGKTFLATALATYLAVGWDLDAIANAALATHVLNAVSPAFTSAFSFARYIVDESAKHMQKIKL